MTIPDVDLTYEGRVQIMARVQAARVRIHAAAEETLRNMEQNATETIKRSIESATIGAVKEMLGIKSFGDVEKGGVLWQTLKPYVDKVAARVAARFERKEPTERHINVVMRAVEDGFDRALQSYGLELGKELADKHKERIRYELLGGEDFVQQTEKKIIGEG